MPQGHTRWEGGTSLVPGAAQFAFGGPGAHLARSDHTGGRERLPDGSFRLPFAHMSLQRRGLGHVFGDFRKQPAPVAHPVAKGISIQRNTQRAMPKMNPDELDRLARLGDPVGNFQLNGGLVGGGVGIVLGHGHLTHRSGARATKKCARLGAIT